MRVNPRFIDKIVKLGLNAQAFFTYGILILIVATICFKGFHYINFEFVFSSTADMGRRGGFFPSII